MSRDPSAGSPPPDPAELARLASECDALLEPLKAAGIYGRRRRPAPTVARSEGAQDVTRSLYFVQRGAGGPVKIGVSTDVASRVRTLQCASEDELRLLVTVPTSELAEREAHRRFAPYRIRGEWFRAEGELLAFIENRSAP